MEARKAYLLIVVVLGGCMAAILGVMLLIGFVASLFPVDVAPTPARADRPSPGRVAPGSEPPTAVAGRTPEAIASETPPDVSAASPAFPPFPGPASLQVGGQQVAPSHMGGCWGLYFEGEIVGQDGCGPNPFDLDAESTLVAPAASLVFIAPGGCSFSSDDLPTISRTDAWQVTVAPVSSLEGLPMDRQESIYLAATRQVLGGSDETAATIAVVAPSMPGEYLLELGANTACDGWTWGLVLHHWRITIR